MELEQLDVTSAFLYGDLKDEVYLEVPSGFTSEYAEGKVCELKKASHGLKQSPRAWFDRFTKAMMNFGYEQNNGDMLYLINTVVTKQLLI